MLLVHLIHRNTFAAEHFIVPLRGPRPARESSLRGRKTACGRTMEDVMSKSFGVSFAPENLWQPINPMTVSLQNLRLFDIDLGHAKSPDLEREILDDVGSYGRQIGRIGDAVEVLLRHFKHDGDLTEAEQNAIAILKAQLAEIREIKEKR
jgi:hypothetical protein